MTHSTGSEGVEAAARALLALVERLDDATGPDRELDAEIAVAIHGGEIVWGMVNWTMDSAVHRKYRSTDHVGGWGKAPVERYTSSLDAALTLCDPDAEVATSGDWWSVLYEALQDAPALVDIPRFVCIAALKARSVRARAAANPSTGKIVDACP